MCRCCVCVLLGDLHFKFPLDSRVFCCLQKAKVRHPFEGCGCRDGAIAPASESTVTPLHHLAGARAAVDEWHHRTNSPNVFAAVACAASSAHPDGVAVQCLACPTFNGKDKAGEPRLYKFGPFGGNRANCKYDVGHFVSRRLRSTKRQQNWAAFFERTMRVLPRGEALPSARPAAPPPLTHLDVMRHTHAKDFEITSSTWLCRRCGHQGTLNASTTPGSLLSHLSSARRNRLQPVRLAASRCAQFFVVSDSVKRRRAVELRFPRSHQAARWHAQAEGLQPLQVAVVNRYGRTTTKDVAPAAPAKRPPTVASAGPPGKAPRVERTPASSKAAGKRPTSGTTVVAKPRVRWEPTGWAARKEPLRSECVQRYYTLLTKAGGDWRNPLPQADGSSLVLRMRSSTKATPSRSVGSWLRGGPPLASTWWTPRVVAGRSVGLSVHHRCLQLRGLGRSW